MELVYTEQLVIVSSILYVHSHHHHHHPGVGKETHKIKTEAIIRQ